MLKGSHLNEIEKLTLGDLTFTPAPSTADEPPTTLHLALPPNAPAPPTHIDDHLTAKLTLRDGRTLSFPITVSTARPVITLLRKTSAAPAGSTITLSNPDDLALTSLLTFTLKSPMSFPRNGQLEIETLDGTLRTVLTLAPSGGLLMQDPHTVVATLDPLRSFGPSAFGALHVRAVFPPKTSSRNEPSTTTEVTVSPEDSAAPASDWLPLANIVRLPTLTQLQCPPEAGQPCTVTGNNLFLIEDVSTSPAFDDPQPVPDGYTGTTLSVPHPSAATLFLKLRDDPANIDSAILPVPTHVHNATHAAPPPPAAPPSAPATPAKQESPAPISPSSPSKTN